MSSSYLQIQRMKEFLLLYKGFPCLWDSKSDHYKDKVTREMALDVLLDKYKTMFPDANKDTLKRKIDMMRSSYKRELKKVLDDNSHKPSLWYFPYMKFLDEPIFTALVQSEDINDAEAENIIASNHLSLLNQDHDDDDDDPMVSVYHSDDKSEVEKETITIFYNSDDDSDNEDTRDEVPELASPTPRINKNSVLYSLLTSDVDQLKKAKLNFHTAREDFYEEMDDEPTAKRLKPNTPTTSNSDPSERERSLRENSLEIQQPTIVQRQSARKRINQIPSTLTRTKPDPLLISSESPLGYPIYLSSPELESSTSSKSEDETIAFGKAIGIQMKELTPLQKTVATKLISDVIFYGRLDRLTTATSIHNLKEN